MNITKKDIVKMIKDETSMSLSSSRLFFEKFLGIIKEESFIKNKTVKISGFGSFKIKSTPKRLGRNPKTKDSYIINPRKKLSLSASSKIRDLIN